jgi:hypothetical protein
MKGWDLFHEEHLEKVEMANPKLSNEEHSMVSVCQQLCGAFLS